MALPGILPHNKELHGFQLLFLSPKSTRSPSTFSKKSFHPAHFLYRSLHFFSFLFQLSPEILLLLPAHSPKNVSLTILFTPSLLQIFFFSLPKTLCSCFPSKPPPIPLLTLYSLLTLFSYKNFFFSCTLLLHSSPFNKKSLHLNHYHGKVVVCFTTLPMQIAQRLFPTPQIKKKSQLLQMARKWMRGKCQNKIKDNE